jgi:hypothetical protein
MQQPDHGLPARSSPIAYADSVLADLRSFADDDLSHYSDCLRAAFRITEPVFVRERYGEFFWRCATTVPGWLAIVVIANASAESEGSAKLVKLWQGIQTNEDVAEEVLVHAEDEAGHSRLFVELAGAAFPSMLPRTTVRAAKRSMTTVSRRRLEKSCESHDEHFVIDNLVQMNIGEIRTRAHMHLLGPAVFAASPDSKRDWVRGTIERLGRDELRHIGYTARHMESWCRDGQKDRIAMLYATRLKEFHVLTVSQTEAAVNSYGGGRYPDLLEI